MAYNIKFTAEEVEHLAVVLHKHGATDTCERLAEKFATIMARSPRMVAAYNERRARGQVMPAQEGHG